MTTVEQPGRFTTLPDDETLAATVVALEEHGFSVEVVDDLDAAREAVLARIPEGSSVMTNTSVTLQEAGIAAAVDEGGPYESARNKMMALDFATQLQEMKAIAGQPDFALGSVHAITRDGALVIASASGSQLASYVWGAANVIFVVGAQKLVPTAEEARERIDEHSLPLEDARAYAAYGQNSSSEDPRDPPGDARPHPRRSRPTVGRLLRVAMSAEVVTHPAVGAEDRRRWLALAVIVTAQFMVVLDISIVNVALPSIKTDLNFSQESLQWVITAYSIFFGGFLLLGGRLADLFGRRRLFMAGLVLFTVSSLLNGLAWSEGSLIAFRCLQGLGAAMMSPAALSILTTTFEEGRDRNRALGIWGAVAGSGGAVGVLLGGILTSAFSWPWIFYVNVPVGAAVLALSPLLLRESRADLPNRYFDFAGAATITSGLMLLVYGMTRATQHGWGTAETIGLLTASAVLIASFFVIESRYEGASAATTHLAAADTRGIEPERL